MLLAWFISGAFTFRVLIKMLNSHELDHSTLMGRVLKKSDLIKLQMLINRWSLLNVSITYAPVFWLPYYLKSLQLCPWTAVRLACKKVACQFLMSAGLKCLSPVGAAFSLFQVTRDLQSSLSRSASFFPEKE